MNPLELTHIQCMAGCEALQQSCHVCIHCEQDGDVKDLVRASPNIKFTRCKTFRNPELPMLVSTLVSQGMKRAANVQTYRVEANSGAIESKLKQIPFHSRVLEHVFQPVSVDSMQDGYER